MAEIDVRWSLQGWNANQLRLRVPQIVNAYGQVLDVQLKEEIKSVQFAWPRPTYRTGLLRKTKSIKRSLEIYQAQGRRAGYWVYSPRDIVDSGNFLRSQDRSYPTATSVQFKWDAKSEKGFPYAASILLGSAGFVSYTGAPYPPRDWITPALTKLPLDRFFAREWQRLGASGR